MAIYSGTVGNDSLVGTTGVDVLTGFAGSDTLEGDKGSDTYVFSKGAGVDYIREFDIKSGDIDVVRFQDVKSTDVISIERLADDSLVLTYGAGDQLIVEGFFLLDQCQVEFFQFNDVVVWDVMDITNRVVTIGREVDDYLTGYFDSSSNRILGFGGNDVIYGGSVNDSLDGGDGDDFLFGGSGDDTLVAGDGTDYMSGGAGDDFYVITSPNFDIVDSGGTDTVYINVSFTKLPSYIENVVYVDGAQALPYWIDALLNDNATGYGYQRLMGTKNIINYAYPTVLPSYDIDPEDAYQFSGFNATQKKFSKQALTYISSVLDLKFVEVSDPAATNTISFGNNYQQYSSGYAYLPSPSFLSRDLFLDIATPSNLSPADGTVSALILIHELGHTLGLEHPFAEGSDAPHLTGTEDSTQWTVMSYEQSADQYHLQYSELDIAALQYLYGPSSKARTGNDMYVVNSQTSNFVWDGAGVDTLDASAQTQAATLYLEAGYWGFIGSKASQITAAGQVTVNFGSAIENLTGGSGNDSLYGNALGNLIKGGFGHDTISGGDGHDTLIGGLGNDSLAGGGGLDTASYADATGSVWVSLGLTGTASSGADGTDVLSGIENLLGSAHADTLIGNTGANRIDGGTGNDSLDGGTGADTLLGGLGDDQYTIDNIADVITEKVSEGTDTVVSTISFVLSTHLENLRLGDAAGINATGNSQNNILWAGAGDNILNGAGGIDTASFAYAGAGVTASLSSKKATGGSGNDTLSSMENLIGSAYADELTGSTAANRLEGGAGNDTLNGGSGADTLLGGTGDDQYTVDNIADVITENAGQGTDTVLSSVSFVLAANVENLRLTASTAINATGNDLNNILWAGAGNNILDGASGIDTASFVYTSAGVTASLSSKKATGGSGTDTLSSVENLIGTNYADTLTGNTEANRLEGGAGNDTLNGGTGADILLGGTGDDQYTVDNSADVVTESASQGTDTVLSSTSFALGSNIENLRLTASTAINATGNSLDNILWAGAGNNVLTGAGGFDTVSYVYTSGAVSVNLALSTAQATGGSGSDTLSTVENLIGSNYADNLTGNNAANALTGGNGNDTLNGSAGNDTLSGGTGNDYLTGGKGQDQLSGGKGADSFDFKLLSEMGLTAASWDSISDFNGAEGDRIDLSTLDGDTKLAGDQAFSFIGSSSFTAAGQLRYDAAAGMLYGSVDADAAAEFAIQLVGNPAFVADYLLA